MKKYFKFLCLLSSIVGFSQNSATVELVWNNSYKYFTFENSYIILPFFENNSYDVNLNSRAIFCKEIINFNNSIEENSISISNIVFENISEQDIYNLNPTLIPNNINAKIESVKARDTYVNVLSFSPIVIQSGVYKRVKSLQYGYSPSLNGFRSNQSISAIQNSVLATGNWYRFYVEKSGLYKISKSFLQSLGFNTNVDPRTIKIFGNGGRMVPLLNSAFYPNDLEENAIEFIGEQDGVFNDTDYILFYAEGVDVWNTESLTSKNLFADKTYYYVTSSGGNGKRIQEAIQPSNVPNFTYTNYDQIKYYEKDLVNVAKVGRRWFGEQFNISNSQSFSIEMPGLINSQPIDVKINLASKSLNISSFSIKLNGQSIGNVNFPAVNPSAAFDAYENTLNYSGNTNSSTLNFQLDYNNSGVPTANGYLDFIRVKAKSSLQGFGQQFQFFNEEQSTNIGVGEYIISNASAISKIWDISDIYNVSQYSNSGNNTFSFKVSLGTTKNYLAVVETDAYLPLKESNASVLNQNIKGTIFLNNQGNFQDIDYLIITPNFLVSQAERLANFHRSYSALNVKVVTLESIYQEFSSGKQDIAAIRNLIKYVYWNASSSANRVKYVNLFGDASYDYKDRISNNTNIVPIFHGFNPNASELNNTSNMSLYTTFLSDDFFGLMDDSEGQMLGGIDGIDIAVGRMIVSTLQQAEEMVTKVIEYHTEESYGRWRNNYVIYSDDADTVSDAQLQVQLDNLADVLVAQKPFVNVKKIHTDAYVQEVAAGGERYPEAKNDFLNAFDIGALVFNYFGHGSEEFLARERLFEKLEAQNLNNKYKYPLFITITCDFTRFDDPGRNSGGEYMYWNSDGGAIAMVATTRQIAVTTGQIMNNLFAEKLYAYGSFNYPTIAEALRLAKLQVSSDNRRVVSYIGDPALKLAIPKPRVVLTEVNDIPVTQPLPVFQALSLMKVEGEVVDESNNLLSNYNGELAIQIFDKNINRSTLGNNGVTNTSGQLITMDFVTLGETIFRGNASVQNGKFEISFIVPQDIRIPVGNGKISFYAKREPSNLEDQTGYDQTIQIGGVNTNAVADNTPPTVQLYMNDESFVSGDITNCSPILIAHLQDEHGINTASGIGHDIVAILDGDESNPYILNDYYETELDDFTRGFVRFPFRDLEAGMHTILFKAWDVYNNLITMEIQFNAVCSSDGLRIERVLNYPNPFVNYTEFWFTHNMPFEPLDVQVQILTITGKLVKTINQQVVTDGFLCREITWDGRDDFGDKIGKGVYIYKLTVKSNLTGNKTEKFEKLVIL